MTTKHCFAVIVVALAVVVAAPRPAHAAASASDTACSTGYSGTGDWTGNNGGSGFGVWSKTIVGGGLLKRGSSGVNDNNSGAPTIDTSCSGSFSWGMNAGGNAGNTAQVTRVFTAGSTASASLLVGQTFSIDMDNGYVDSPGYVGFSLQNNSSQDVFAFTCLPSAGYYTNGATTGIGYTGHGLRLIVTITSSNACTLQILNPNTSTTTNTYTNVGFLNPAGGQAIGQVALYARACGGGTSSENNHDLYFNTMSISCASFTATVPNANVCPGATASFTVLTSAASTLTYQWQVSTNGGVAWNSVSTGTGGTTASYTTATTTVGDNGKMFRCLLTDVCGDIVTSSAGTLNVLNTGPSIAVQPSGQGACSNATFSVTASNAVSYLWYKGPTGSGVALSNGGSVSGATTSALTLNGLLPGDNGANFYVVVSGCGTPQTSSGAALTINVPPLITGEPVSATVCAGSSTNFSVTATGIPLNYAWRKRGTGWGANGWTLTGGGGGFFIGDSSSNGSGSSGNINTLGQSWGLSNVTASSVTEAIRTFPTPLQIGQQFQIDMDNGYVTGGNEVGFSLRNASGNIVWEFIYVGGNSGSFYTINDNAGTNNIPVTYTDGGLRIILTLTSPTNYSATVETSPVSIGNTTTYGPFTGTLKGPAGGSVPAQVRLWSDNDSGGANYGLFFNSMIVNGADDDNATAYNNSTWAAGQTPNFGDVALSDGGSISGSATPTLSLTGVSTNDSGAKLDCVVTGGTSCGGTIPSSVATLTVYGDSGACILQPPAGVPAYVGGSANFTVVAQGLSYQWYKGSAGGGVALSNGGSVSGATGPTLTLSGLTLGDSGGNFYVVVGCCGGSMEPSAGAGLSVTVAPDGFLKANGLNVRNGHGNGDIVPLHGVNLGAWLIMEGWMCPMDTSGLPYFLAVVQTLESRFGTNTEESLIRTYQDTWIMANDLDNIRAMGMNMIRVPVMWTDLQRLDGTWRTDAYDRLDWVVSNAWQRGIYTLIDLHGVPGGVAVTQSAGTEDNAYWTNTADQVETAMIWSNLATHYLGNPAVAGYDLINEPYGAPTQQAIWDMYNNLYQVVRPIDPDHIIMMEATWKGTGTNGEMLNWVWDVLPPPTLYGWSNVVYSLHEYHFEDTTDVGPIETGMVNQVIDYDNHKIWNVPDYIGEFNMFTPGTGTDPQTVWQFGMQLLNTNGINWTVWSYKSTHGNAPDSWGLYDYVGNPPPTPNLATDTVATISNDWSQCGTVPGFGINPLLQVSLGGPLALSDLYLTTAGTTLSVNSSSGVLANDMDINLGQPGIHLTAALVNGPTNGVLTLNADGSFSYTPNAGFTGTDTFRYQVNDGYASSVNIATVVIEVSPAGPPPSTFQAWQVQYFGSTTNPLAAASADPYGKGISNTNQFLLGLNPVNPASTFKITSETPQGPNVVIAWKAAGVRTNALQAAPGGGYGTNGFADISGPIIINVTGDTTTNYTDSGGATNRPARYYRIRLVP